MNYSKFKLKDISTIRNGSTPSTLSPEFYEGNITWITPKDLSKQNTRYIHKGERSITQAGFDSCSTTMLPKGTVLLSSRAPIGLLSIAGSELCTNQGFKNIVPDLNKINSEYLYYYLKINISDIEKLGSGTTFKEIPKSSIEKFEVLIPDDVKYQKKVSSVLSALDLKIELNNRINTELEVMAKTIYDYWFVQFDFSDEHGKPYKASGGEMVWNEPLKKKIPRGWAAKKLVDWIADDKSGDWGNDTPTGNYLNKVNCIRGTDINGLNGLEECNPPVRFILEKNSHKILNSHDLIIEISGGSPTQSTGRLGYITDASLKRFDNPLICSNFCKAISLKDKKLLYNFVYYWDSLYKNGVLFGHEGKTSGIKNLLFDSFVNSFWTVVPNNDVAEKFYGIMQNIQEKKQAALSENQTLSELRDWLLPMLMNGQVKVQ